VKHCSQYIQNICDYVDGDADHLLCEEIEKHLAECKNCQIMVDTLKQTVVLCRDGKQEPLPPELEKRFNDALRKKWEKKFGKSG